MNDFYSIVNGEKVEVKLLKENSASVNGKINFFSIQTIDSNSFSIIYKNKNFNCRILGKNRNHFRISINNSLYLVDCKNKLEFLAEEISSAKMETNKDIIKVYSPMTGLVLKIIKKDGEIVKKDEPVLILEAMKMENEILAPTDGTLTFLEIKEGDTIEKNTKLFEINNLLFKKKY